MHHTPLIATIVAGLAIAFVLGLIAHRFRISPLVGYLAAGVMVGPFTPGYVADQGLANELAEIGVILLMFGVGLHFSLKDLMSVRKIAIPGAVGQMAVATLLGMGLAHLLGWPLVSGLVFGLALSVASTVVLLRALQERRLVQTDRGKIAVGWLIVEDLAMVLALVLLPALAGGMAEDASATPGAWIGPLAITIGKVIAFVAFMLIVGRRVVPWLLHYVAHTGSRELFRLAVLAIALGIAFGSAALFGVSFALGAFFAGMILAESELSHRAAEETLPLRDAFAVLFFVSVGMLFDPRVVLETPLPLLATVGIIVLGKSLAAYGIVRAFGRDNPTALTISASLAQIGEFSFILAALSVELNLLPPEGRDLILGGAIISILLNPLIFGLILGKAVKVKAAGTAPAPPEVLTPTLLSNHVILVGYGRVGQAVAKGLEALAQPFLILELSDLHIRRASQLGYEALGGNAADPALLAAAGVSRARRVIVTIPDGFEAGGVVQEARRCNTAIEIVARAHSDAEVDHLMQLGADRTVLGEQELAAALLGANAAADIARPSPAPPTPASPAAILSDAEWALLAHVRDLELNAGSTVAIANLSDGVHTAGFTPQRLEAAYAGLLARGLLSDLGDGRARLTGAGLSAAGQAPQI